MKAKPKPAKRMGRPPGPTKLTPEATEKIVNALRGGNYVEVAAAYAELDTTTLYDWLRKGRVDRKMGNPDTAHARFSLAIEKAMADAETTLAALIYRAARGQEGAQAQWQAAAWLLERKHPDKWGRRARLDIGGTEGAEPMRVVVDLGTGRPD